MARFYRLVNLNRSRVKWFFENINNKDQFLDYIYFFYTKKGRTGA